MSDGPAMLVLQHIACEPPGAYEDVMRERGARLHTLLEAFEARREEMTAHARTMFARWLELM